MITDRTVAGGPAILGVDVSPVAVGYRQLAGLDAASTIPDVPPGACRALIAVSGAPVRWRDDGVMPTPQVGMPIAAGETIEFLGDVSALQLIGPGAVVDVSLYR